jgi:hypothetical protein
VMVIANAGAIMEILEVTVDAIEIMETVVVTVVVGAEAVIVVVAVQVC